MYIREARGVSVLNMRPHQKAVQRTGELDGIVLKTTVPRSPSGEDFDAATISACTGGIMGVKVASIT